MFKTEKSFVKTITKTAEKERERFKILKGELLIKKEVGLGYGIPDIVIAGYKKKITPKRNHLLSLFDISVLRLIKNNENLDINQLFDITRSSKQKIKKSIKKLLEDKIITLKNEIFYSFEDYKSILTNSVAIEAKLRDWKKALNQAYRYKWFSEKSFVFIPKENINPAYKNMGLFKRMNVGLGTISNNKKIEILFDPEKEDPYSEEMSLFLNECLLINLSLISKRISKKKGDS